MSVLRVTVPVVLQRNSEGFWLEFKGDNKEVMLFLGDLNKGPIVQACIHGWAQDQLTVALKSKRRITGLTDKTGAVVHEGDILQFEDKRGVVKWEPPFAAFIVLGANFKTQNLHSVNQAVVLGNIFENPELL